MQQRLNKLLSVLPHSLHYPFEVVSKVRHDIIYTPTGTSIGYVRYQRTYDDFLAVIDEEAVFFDPELDYSQGYTLFSMLTGLDRLLQALSIHPMGDTGKYRLWILRYGEHYLIIEIGYDKLRESIREHQFQLTFNKGIPYETLSRRSYG